jgi:AcrR family transcriptional regulator
MAGKRKSNSGARKSGKQRTKLDWLTAGEDILRDKGFPALKLAALTGRLGVSTGSFYHHFRDFDDYLAQLAKYFDGAEVIQAMREAAKNGAGPITRLDNLRTISTKTGLYALDEAMRDWAVTDKRAKAALERARKMTQDFYADAFRDMGYNKEDALLRARMLIAVKIMYAHADVGKTASKFHKLALEVLTRDAAKSKLT